MRQKGWGRPAEDRSVPAAQLYRTSVAWDQVPDPGLGHKGFYREGLGFDDRQEVHGHSRVAWTVPRQTGEAQSTWSAI